MFGIGVDDLGKILGGAAAVFITGLLGWIGRQKNKADEAARPAQPAGMGIMLDGDTATALLREAKAIRDDLERWRTEDLSRAKDDKIERLEAQLAKASGTTHENQAGIAERQDETDRKLGLLLEALNKPDISAALQNLKVH